MFSKLLETFPAFRSKNYRLYFASQLVSLVGTWLQIIAQSWLVLQLTNSAFMVGLISALGFLPILFFSLFGGVIVDHFRKRDLLIFTNATSMVLALILGFAALFNLVTIPLIAVLSFLLGVVNALDMPTRQSFTIEMVGREALPSAIALNMGMFNASRVIGPAIAGLLIARFGNAGAFILNGLSFIAPIIALLLMHVSTDVPNTHFNPLPAIKEGLIYTFNHSLIKSLIIFTTFLSIFGFSYATILPVIAKNIFNQGADGLGIMYAASGIGALAGTALIGVTTKKFSALQLIVAGTIVFALALIAFSLTANFTLALVLLFIQGIAMTLPFAMINSSIQHHVEDSVRGRVSSIYTLAFMGMQPFGSFQVGFLADRFGSPFALQMGAVVTLLAVGYLAYSLRVKIEGE